MTETSVLRRTAGGTCTYKCNSCHREPSPLPGGGTPRHCSHCGAANIGSTYAFPTTVCMSCGEHHDGEVTIIVRSVKVWQGDKLLNSGSQLAISFCSIPCMHRVFPPS